MSVLAALFGALLVAVPQAAPAHADAAGLGGNFVSLTSGVRVLDTRNKIGVGTTTPLAAGGTSTAFQVTGFGGLPSTGVTGVIATVSVLDNTADTYVTVFPGSGTVNGQSSVHAKAGNNNISNSVTTPLSATGTLKAFNNAGTAHVVIDVVGYFVSDNGTGGGFVPVQGRAVDSRSDVGTTGGALAVGTNRTITLPTSLVPSSASAVYVNLLVPSATQPGYISASAAGTGGSFFSYQTGSSSSGMSVKVNAGKIVLRNSAASGAAAHFVIDIEGYWTNSPTTGAGYRATPSQGALMNTVPFDTQMPAGATYKFRVAGALGLPTQKIAGVLLNVHVRNQATVAGHFDAWPTGSPHPNTSVNNAPSGGETRDSLNIVKPGNDGTISIYNGGTQQADVFVEIQGYFADPLPALPIESAPRLTGLQRAGAAGTVRPIDFAFTTASGWLEVGRIPDPSTLSVDETTYQLLSGGDTFTQSPSLSEGSDGKLTVVGHRTDSNVWSKTETTAGTTSYPVTWTKRGGSPTGPPVIARLSDNRQVLLGVDADGALWAGITPTVGAAFDAWRYLGNAALAGAVTVVPNTTGGATLFARTAAGTVTTSTFTIGAAPNGVTGEWNDKPVAAVSAWTDLGNPGSALDATGTPSVAVNGTQRRLVVRKADGTIWTRLYNGASWSAWSQISGITTAAGQPTALLHPVNGTYQVLVRSSTGALAWVSEISANSGTWTTWKNTYAGVASDPSVITWSNQDNSKAWGVLFSDTAGHNVIGNFTTAIPPSPAAGAVAKAAGTGDSAARFTVLKAG